MYRAADADSLPTLLGSRRPAYGRDSKQKVDLEITIPEPETLPKLSSNSSLPEDYFVPVRVRNTFIDIPDTEEEQPARQAVHSCPARHAGCIAEQWNEAAGSNAGCKTSKSPVAMAPEAPRQKQVVLLVDAFSETFPGTPEAFHIPRMRTTHEAAYEASRPAGSVQAPAAALGLVCPRSQPAEVPHAVYNAVHAMQAVHHGVIQHHHAHWPGADMPVPHQSYAGYHGCEMESMPQTFAGMQVGPMAQTEFPSQLRAEAAPWYSSQIREEVPVQHQHHQHHQDHHQQVPFVFLAQPSPAPAEPAPGSLELPSIGSQGHGHSQCKPCAFLHTKGCDNGAMCKFCHLCDGGEKKRRQKEKRHILRGGA